MGWHLALGVLDKLYEDYCESLEFQLAQERNEERDLHLMEKVAVGMDEDYCAG